MPDATPFCSYNPDEGEDQLLVIMSSVCGDAFPPTTIAYSPHAS